MHPNASDLEGQYKNLHRHPELSMQEQRTAGLAAERLSAAGVEVTAGIGGTGVVGLLRNGEGPTVMLRADMDALPVAEQTGLEDASMVEGVMHACGHDMHVGWLAGATAELAATRGVWHGTLLAVFQPAEESAAGTQAMIDDGLFDRFPRPDVILGQHVMPAPAGSIGVRAGVVTSAADSTVLRLQTIVARELAPAESAVFTVGALQAGTKENVIPDEATIKLNVRTFDEGVRTHVLDAIERIVNAEAHASGAPKAPEITPLDRYQLVRNDAAAADRVRAAFGERFGEERVVEIPPISASEDFGSLGSEWQTPSMFWTVGGTDPDTYRQAKETGRLAELPTNHSPRFAPVIHPTLETGVATLVAAASAWLAA